MKKLVILMAVILMSVTVMAWPLTGYLKIDDIDGESQAKAAAKMGYKALSRKYKVVQVEDGKESSLEPGYYLHPNGKLLRITAARHKQWIPVQSVSSATIRKEVQRNKTVTRPIDATSGMSTGKRDAATGLPTGKRQHKAITIAKELCVDGKVTEGQYKGRGCTHRGHVTVLK